MTLKPENQGNTPPETPLERAKSIFETLLQNKRFICFKPATEVESTMVQKALFNMGYIWLIGGDDCLKTNRIVIDPDTGKLFTAHPDETEKNKVIVKSSIFGEDFQLKAAKAELGVLIKRTEILQKTIEMVESSQSKNLKNTFKKESQDKNPPRPMPAQLKRSRRKRGVLKPDNKK